MPDMRIYGNPAEFRRKLRSRVTNGRHLLDEMESARERLSADLPNSSSILASLENMTVLEPVQRRMTAWAAGNRRLLETHLGEAANTRMPVWSWSFRYDHAASPSDYLAASEGFVREDTAALEGILSVIPARKRVSTTDQPVRLDVLWSAGLFDPEVLAAYEQRMATLGSRRGRSAAIGAAKELLESTFRVALRRLGEPDPRPDEDLLSLARQLRRALERLTAAAPDAHGSPSFDRLQSGLASVVQGIAEVRNLYGTGHGRVALPAGLQARHARLAVDSAAAYARFVVLTLDDLGLLAQAAPDVGRRARVTQRTRGAGPSKR